MEIELKEHKIVTVTTEGQDYYPSPISGYLTEQDTPEFPTASISVLVPAEKLHLAFEQGMGWEAAFLISVFTKQTCRKLPVASPAYIHVKCAQKDGLFLPEIVYSNSHLCIIGLKWVVPLEALW